MPVVVKRQNKSEWDAAIEAAQHRIRELEFSIRVFRQRKRKGEKWPFPDAVQVEKKGTVAESVPAKG
jgi:hypothetical protein